MSSADQDTTDLEQTRRKQAIEIERRRWWELRECYARCVGITRDQWDAALDTAEGQQHELAVEMRDRTATGKRATGVEYPIDRGIEVQLLTPYARLKFLKEAAVTLFIEACKKSLSVTPEGKRAAQKADAPEGVEAGSGVDETLEDADAERLAQAGEAAALGGQALAFSAAPAP